MAFTSKLGTNLSKLVEFKLATAGGGGPQTYNLTQIIAGIASASRSGNFNFLNFLEIDCVAAVTPLPGTGWSNSVTIDGIASAAGAFVYKEIVSLSIDGVARVDAIHTAGVAGNQVIAAVASAARSNIATVENASIIASVAIFEDENLYNNLLDVTAVGSMTFNTAGPTNNPEGAAGVAGFSATSTATLNRTINQTFSITQATHQSPPAQHPAQPYAIAQSLIVVPVRVRNVTQTLTYTQDAYRSYPTNQNLAYTQSAVGTKVHVQAVAQTFVMHQQGIRNLTYHQTVVQTYAPVNGHYELLPVDGLLYYHPAADYVLIPAAQKKCFITLKVPAYTLVLPCPQLGDGQDYLGTLKLSRSMTGETYTYVRRSNLNSLRYTFWLGRAKTLETENFVFKYGSNVIDLYNWKGEHWVVHLTSNPNDFTGKERYQPQGERYELVLEFTGIKVGG